MATTDTHDPAERRFPEGLLWGTATAVYRHYIQRHAAVEFIVALYINMAFTAYFFWNYENVPFFGASSIVGDLLGTAVILPIVVGFIVVGRVSKHLRAGELPIPKAARPGRIAARILPSPLWLRAIVLAIHGVLAAMLALIALWMLRIDAMPFWLFVIFQGTFAGALAAYIVAISGYRVIVENVQDRDMRR